MLSFEHIKEIFNSYPIEERSFEDGRLSYYYKGKQIIREFSHTGNGYIWGKDIKEYTNKYDIDPRGWINFKKSQKKRFEHF